MIRTIIPDKTTSVTAAQAITAALFYRERAKKGQHIKLAMLDTMIAYLWPEAMSVLSFVGNEGDPKKVHLVLIWYLRLGIVTLLPEPFRILSGKGCAGYLNVRILSAMRGSALLGQEQCIVLKDLKS